VLAGRLVARTVSLLLILISRTAINQDTGAVPPYLDLNQAGRFPSGVAVLIPRMIRRGLLIYG
jgi:hypothetical protein